MLRQLRNAIMTACLLFAVDLLSNTLLGLMFTIIFGFPLFLVKLARRRKDRERRRLLLVRAGIYFVMLVAIAVAFLANDSLAMRRAQSLIAACEQYKAKTGGYPQKLTQLVPDYLPAIPPAKLLVLSGESFFYIARPDGHSLCYTTVFPVGGKCFDLEEEKWQMPDN